MSDGVSQVMFAVLHGQAAPVVTRWSWSVQDPYAVTLGIRTRRDRWIEWMLGRELLIDGIAGPAGEGDIRLSPQQVMEFDVVAVEIRSADGHAMLEVDKDLLIHFVETTVELVALGDEPDVVDLDLEIEKITRSCTN